jgi:hypothetical protein
LLEKAHFLQGSIPAQTCEEIPAQTNFAHFDLRIAALAAECAKKKKNDLLISTDFFLYAGN